MFEGFKHLRVPTKEAEIDTVAKGSGPPLLSSEGLCAVASLQAVGAPAGFARLGPSKSAGFST